MSCLGVNLQFSIFVLVDLMCSCNVDFIHHMPIFLLFIKRIVIVLTKYYKNAYVAKSWKKYFAVIWCIHICITTTDNNQRPFTVIGKSSIPGVVRGSSSEDRTLKQDKSKYWSDKWQKACGRKTLNNEHQS